MESVCQDGLFDEALIEKDETGRWTLPREHGMKLMAVCYFMMHRKVFAAADTTAADVFRRCENNTFIDTVRETIWRPHGASGKKNCPAPDALGYQVQRCGAVLSYWQSAFDEEMKLPEFRGQGWRAVSGPEENLTSENVVIQLSEYALLGKGKVKILTCGCNPDKNPKCDRCRCHKAGRRCVPRFCKCQLKCRALDDMVSVNPDEAGDVEGFSDDYDAGSDSAESVESGPDMDGTLDEMDSEIEV